MVPYVYLRTVNIGPVHFQVFSALLVGAIVVGFLAASYRARQFGITREQMARLSLAMVSAGALGASVLKLAYVPGYLAHRLFTHLPGLASFGGLFGGLAGALLLFHFSGYGAALRLRYLDAVGFALPFGWAVGRAGCSLVHDHPGVRGDSWFAVAYPGGARFDLGVLECLFLLILALTFAFLALRPRPAGFFFALFFAVYGPFRLVIDQFHVDPPRYFGWTVDQYCSVLALVVAAWTAWLIVREPLANPFSGDPSCSPASLHG
jgi:phosphatidylglycerol:prolipoprotein diacylglycerol transferase